MVAGRWHGCNGRCCLMVLVINDVKTMTKAGSYESVDCPMMACDDKSGWQQWMTMQQPTNDRSSKGGGSWCQDHLREVVDNLHQKRPATTVLTDAHWHAMTKVGGGQQHNNQLTTRAALNNRR
jgi:hypothetical protein